MGVFAQSIQRLLVGLYLFDFVYSRMSLVIGLNPALQRTINVPSLTVGSVNRAASAAVGIGGKGQDVFVAASMMGIHKNALFPRLAQFLGKGAEGDALSLLLENIADNKAVISVKTNSPLRTCITLVDTISNEATEIIEPSGSISPDELLAMENAMSMTFNKNPPKGIVVMGSKPPGCPSNYYKTLLSTCIGSQTKILLDTASEVIDLAAYIQTKGSKVIIKLNARELCALVGIQGPTGAEAATATPADIIFAAGDRLLNRIKEGSNAFENIPIFVAITDGPYAAHFHQLAPVDKKYRLEMPPLPGPLINPIGAGDAVSAGTIFAWDGSFQLSGWPSADEMDEKTAFSWGLACGAASCLTNSNSVFSLADAEAIFRKIQIIEV
eukprot:gene10812-22560_t